MAITAVPAPTVPSGSFGYPDEILAPPPPASRRPFLSRVVRGRPADPVWARPGLFALLALTAVLYLWDLGASGDANTFYAAAVQAGTKSWKAMFFGSSDASNFITVDKPPAALWVMDVSARIFGLNSWSLLVPQALEGVATVAVLYAALRRFLSSGAALFGGLVVALTPVAALMFRFNNPDALLVLLLTAAAYAVTRAVESGRTRWLLMAGALIGFGFLAKELQALLVVPPLALVYLLAGPPRLAKRLWQLLLAGAALVAGAGWWVAIVQLTPAADRPYIGGSQNNSLWNVIFGYNGFGRLTGNETGSVGGGGRPGGTSMWGPTGLIRLFKADMGGQISWLIPAALVVLAAGLWWTRRAPRTDRRRAALVLWGSSLLVSGLTISYGQGIIHPYYTIALAPLIGGTLAAGGMLAWERRHSVAGRGVLAAAVVAAAVWGTVLLDRTPAWHPWLRVACVVAAVVAVIGLAAWPMVRFRAARLAVAGVALLAVFGGPAAYTLQTVSVPHTGAIPSAGPGNQGGPGGLGGGRPGFGGGGVAGNRGTGGFARPAAGAGGPGGGGAFGPQGGASPQGGGGFGPGGGGAGRFGPGGGGPPGGGGFGRGGNGLLNGSPVSSSTAAALRAGASGFKWLLATTGSESASTYQLATGEPVMSIGGFNGTDPTPTLAQFEGYVAAHQIHYYVAGGGGGGGFGGSASSDAGAIASWVESHFTAQTVGGLNVYDLTDPTT